VTQRGLPDPGVRSLVRAMRGRDPGEEHRASTPLELFFDLVFVVAVALAAERLHHGLLEDPIGSILSYLLVFFAIWWAWVNFTWFASAYDTDDVVYRLTVLVIMTGALVMAAGLPQTFDEREFAVTVVGYVIMRVALVALWLRVAREDPPRRQTARRFAAGVTACQLGWLGFLVLAPSLWPLAWLVLVPAELLVPYWAERAAPTTWHPAHIAERYGLFMIIVLGESVLASSLAIQTVVGDGLQPELVPVIVGGLLIVYSMWWIYYDRPDEHMLESTGTAYVWSYLHLPIFASAAAVGAGLVVAIEEAAGHSSLGWPRVGAYVAIPLATYLISLWLLYLRLRLGTAHRLLIPATAMLLLLSVVTPAPLLAIGLVLAASVGVKIGLRLRTVGGGGRQVEGPAAHSTS
jgi:low temperature requirement protein LtrA